MKLTKTRKAAFLFFSTSIILFSVALGPFIMAAIDGAVLGLFYSKILFADEIVI